MLGGMRFSRIVTGYVFIILLLTGFTPLAFSGDVSFISHQTVPDNTLAKIDVKNIFLGRKTQWSNGTPIKIVLLMKDDVHETFCKTYLRKTPSQFKAYWRRMVFSGMGQIQQFFGSEKEIIEFIAQTEGSVGYVFSRDITSQVKKIMID